MDTTNLVPNKKLLIKNMPCNVADLESHLVSMEIKPTWLKPFGRRRALLAFETDALLNLAFEKLQRTKIYATQLNIIRFEQKQGKRCNESPKRVHKSTQTSNKLVVSQNSTTPLSTNDIRKFVKDLYDCNNQLDFMQPPPPYLKYAYPQITPDILDAISIELMSNTRFYTQVLHLMNRMNLEPPFVMKQKSKKCTVQKEEQTIQLSKGKEVVITDSESELESDADEATVSAAPPVKRKLPSNEAQYKKKARKVLHAALHSQKRINTTSKCNKPVEPLANPSSANKQATITINLPKDLPTTSKEADITTQNEQLTIGQLVALPIYKNYTEGVPSNKLYIKNLSKHVSEDHLIQLYASYTASCNLDVKLMQHGRMKGQAFVSFNNIPPELCASVVAKALKETNGKILMNKPMIVCYGKQSK